VLHKTKIGTLKDGKFRIGAGTPYLIMLDRVVIVDEEEHHLWGKRYKISGCDDWFEENCFEKIEVI
jgi:hypothetical protein